MVKNVLDGKFDEACSALKQFYDLGYSLTDIITTLFRVVKNYDMAEYLKLEMLKVISQPCDFLLKETGSGSCFVTALGLLKMQSISPLLIKIFCLFAQETGFAHMRICDGVGSFLQLSGLLAKFALVRETAKAP